MWYKDNFFYNKNLHRWNESLKAVFVFRCASIYLMGYVWPQLTLWSHGALSVSIIRLVIRTLKRRKHWCLLGDSFGQCVRLIASILWNTGHWNMTMMILAGWDVMLLPMAGKSISSWNIWTFRCTCSRSSYNWHHKCFTVRWRNVWAEIMVHWVAVARRNGVKVRAVPKRSICIFAAGTFVLSSTRFVRIVRVLLAVNRSQSLGFHDEGLLFFVAQSAPLGTKEFAYFTVKHVRVL